MSSSAGSPPTPPTIRVIQIGQTEFAGALRSMPGVRAHVAESPLDAIAELGMHESQPPAEATAVLLGRIDASDAERAAIVRALRRVDESVRVFAPLHEGDWPAFLIDHTIEAADDLLAAMRPSDEDAAPGLAEQAGAPHPAFVEIRRDALEAVLEARPVLPVVLAELRVDFGDESIRFIAERDDAPIDRRNAAPVTRGGVRFGWLVAPALSAQELTEPAARLAQWLALEAQHHQLREAAFRDPETGAFNRRGGELALDRAIATAADDRRSMSLLLIAALGAARDSTLADLVAAVRLSTRPTDLAVRWSIDRLAVVLADPTGRRDPQSEHPRAVEAILARILSRHPGPPPRLAASIATFPWDGLARGDLVGVAERRLDDAVSGRPRLAT